MDQSQHKGMSMVFVLVISAIFCALATFIAISLLISRNQTQRAELPFLPEQVVVDDLVITLDTDPAKAIFLPGEPELDAGPENVDTALELESSQDIPPEPTAFVEPTVLPSQVIFIPYTVQRGDTLYNISRVQNTSIELMAVYGIDSNDLISGSVLDLPVANPGYCPGMSAYIVRENDTVFSLAQTSGSSPENITAINNLNANATIYTTQVLCLP